MNSIREHRKKANLTIKALADKVKLSEQAISQYELGKRKPNLETLINISKALNINYSELISNSDFDIPNLDDPAKPCLKEFWNDAFNTPEKVKQTELQDALSKIINHCGFSIDLNNDDFNTLESVDISHKNGNFSLSNEEYALLIKDIFDSTVKCLLNAEYKRL